MVSCPQCYCTSLNLVQNRKQGLSFEMKLVWCHIGAIYFGRQREDQQIMKSIVEYYIQYVVLAMAMLV